MIKVTFIDEDNNRHELEATPGSTLMEVATENMVPGIDAECGGSCSCATCHVYVPEEWRAKIGEANDTESILLESLDSVQEGSRLCCQVPLSEDFDGLEVNVAPAY